MSGGSTQTLMQVRPKFSQVFGDYLEVVAPVLTTPSLHGAEAANGTRLVGYVAVGVSRTREFAQLSRINWMVAAVSSLVVLLSLPMALALVHRVFQPIRQLVDATRKITGGDL